MDNISEYIHQFNDRYSAGKALSKELLKYKNNNNAIIVSLPRGGVPVGYEVAKTLNLPLTVFVSRKLGAPNNPEFGVGAIAEEDVIILDKETMYALDLSESDLQETIEDEKEELKRRVKKYRKDELLELENKIIILIDDGLATGVTAKAAIEGIRELNPSKIVFAAPVCAKGTIINIEEVADEVVCTLSPLYMSAIGLFYKDFRQTTDKEVIYLLEESKDVYKKDPKQFLSA